MVESSRRFMMMEDSMDLLTHSQIESLAEIGHGDVQISLFMPTHRFGGGVEVDRLRWKNLVAGVETRLLEQMRRPDVEALLAPARQLQDDAMAWQHMSDGLAMFLRPGWERSFRVPAPMPELATIGDRLVIGPMLRLASGDEHFLLLALSQREIRLMEGGRTGVENIELGEIPTSLADVVEAPEPRSDSMARPAAAAGRGGPAVFYGHTSAGEDVKYEAVMRFLRQVSSGLHDVLAGRTEPLILVGLERLVNNYREINSYGHLLGDAVEHNPDHLSAEELHKLAWPLIEADLRRHRTEVIERFHELGGTGRASDDLNEISEAAATGRVETLLVGSDPWCWEAVAVDSGRPIVQLGADERYADCERIDAAAIATLHNSGRVYATSQDLSPNSGVAAIYRY